MENIDLNLACFVSLERAFCGDSDHNTAKRCESMKKTKIMKHNNKMIIHLSTL